MLLIVATAGSSDPSRASLPFHIAANGAAASGRRCGIVLAGDATEVLRTDIASAVKGLGVPPLEQLLAACLEHEIPLYVCRGCAEARGVTAAHLEGRNAVFINPVELVELVQESDRTVSF
ncbi:MAG: DsrE family protein [Candidatus Dormibacteraceae bacterium]